MRELDNTSIPLPFECFYAAKVEDVQLTEKRVHDIFLDQRVRPSREFFEVAPERVVSALKLVEIEDVTPGNDIVNDEGDRVVLDRARERRTKFNFAAVDIKIGDILTFVDRPEITAEVVALRGNHTIKLYDEAVSPSRGAQIITGLKNPGAGTVYWMFEGETLDERRRRMESGENE